MIIPEAERLKWIFSNILPNGMLKSGHMLDSRKRLFMSDMYCKWTNDDYDLSELQWHWLDQIVKELFTKDEAEEYKCRFLSVPPILNELVVIPKVKHTVPAKSTPEVIAARRKRFRKGTVHEDDKECALYLRSEGYPVDKIANFFNVNPGRITELTAWAELQQWGFDDCDDLGLE